MSEHLYDFQHPLTGGTVRSCLDCGLPVYGGPTRCVPCATGYPDDAKASVEHFVTDATRTLRERNQNLHGVLDRIEKAVGVPTQAATYTADAVEDTIARLTRERDEALASLAAAHRELHRIACGEQIESDGLCGHELVAHEALAEVARLRGVVHTYMTSHDEQIAQERLVLIGQAARERDAARRWSSLWHAEARRLWREVQALSDPDAPYVDIEDVAAFLRKLEGSDP